MFTGQTNMVNREFQIEFLKYELWIENKTLSCSSGQLCGCEWITSILTQPGRNAIKELGAVLKLLFSGYL